MGTNYYAVSKNHDISVHLLKESYPEQRVFHGNPFFRSYESLVFFLEWLNSTGGKNVYIEDEYGNIFTIPFFKEEVLKEKRPNDKWHHGDFV